MNPAGMVCAIALFLPSVLTAQSLPQRSVTGSRQFVIYAADASVRMRAGNLAEDVKTFWLRRAGIRDAWQHPVILMFHEPEPAAREEPIVIGVHEGDGRTQKIQIDVYDPELVDSPRFEAALWQAVFLELAHRDRLLQAGSAFRFAPEWLVEGLAEERRKTGLEGRVLEGLLGSGHQPVLRDVFRRRPPPEIGTERAIFRTLSSALVRTLADLPEGPNQLTTLVQRLRDEDIDADTVMQVYPSLGTDFDHLERLWVLTLARYSATARARPFTLRESAEELRDVMDLSAEVESGSETPHVVRGPAALPYIAETDEGPLVLARTGESLVELELRVHPLYRAVIAEYREIVLHLLRRPKSRVRDRIERNDALAAALMERSGEIDDHMNWYELNHVAAPDPEFQRLLQHHGELLDTVERDDAITLHLDRIENRGW